MKLVVFFLMLLAFNSSMAQPAQQQSPYQKGIHYTEIQAEHSTGSEKAVVYEFFGYMCPHCASFQTYVKPWHEKLPENVELVRVPVIFQPGWDVYAKAYYTAETMGIVEKSHQALFNAIHRERKRFRTIEDIAGWFEEKFSVDKDKFISTANSFMIDARMRQGNKLMGKMGIRSTPSIVVNGKYKLNGKALGGPNGMLELASYLANQENKEKLSNK